MKLKLTLTIAVVIFTVIFSCKKNPEVTGNNKIEIGQTTTENISYTSVEASTTVNTLGGNSIIQHGHCWSIESESTIQDSKTSLGELTQPTTYKSEINELLDNTTYYIRSYLTYSNGTVYGTEQSITTLKSGKPTVSTNVITNVTLYSAQCGGVALADSGLSVLTKGVCWDTAAVFSIENNLGITNDGDSLGTFISEITGLQEGVNYNVKAYATNAKGTSYGEVKQFSTVAITLPTVITSSPTNINANSAESGGDVTDDGNGSVTARGICWSLSSNPSLLDNIGYTVIGSGLGSFSSNISGLADNTTYYVAAYATNEKGTSYGEIKQFSTAAITLPEVVTVTPTNILATSATGGGNVTSNGNGTVTAKGVCWSFTDNPTLENSLGNTINGSGNGEFTSSISGLTDNKTYYVAAYATNEKGISYGLVLEFTTLEITLPQVNTTNITNITAVSAQGGGNVISNGNGNVTIRGVCWDTTANPTLSDNHTSDGNGTGIFVSNITGLSPSTQYYARAYATNEVGTAYGNIFSFISSGGPCVGQTYIDYEGQTYNIVEIGGQCWMNENLNYQTNNSWCYNYNSDNCETYGRLYDWQNALVACPSGWHLPSDDEWKTLEIYLGMSQSQADSTGHRGTNEGMKLKSLTGWDNNGNGTNSSGFNGSPAGYRDQYGNFYGWGAGGYWWSNTEYVGDGWVHALIYNSQKVYRNKFYKPYGLSVRCLKD